MCLQLDQKLPEKLKLVLVAPPPRDLKKRWGGGDGYGTLSKEREPAEYPSRSEWELNVSYNSYLKASESKWKQGRQSDNIISLPLFSTKNRLLFFFQN